MDTRSPTDGDDTQKGPRPDREPFRAHAELAILDAFLTRATVGLQGLVLPADARLMQRGVADIVEAVVRDTLVAAAETNDALRASLPSSKRSMEDIRFDVGDAVVYVDVKTLDLDGEFSMPNVCSIDRLAKFYKSGTNVFLVLNIEYAVGAAGVRVKRISWRPVETMCWSALAIGAIGKGQLQVKDAHRDTGSFAGDRCAWMLRLYEEGASHYSRVKAKATVAEAAWLGMVAGESASAA